MKKLLIICSSVLSAFVGYSQLIPSFNDILIPMRDGKFLSADVYIPSNITEGEVILIQTPYNKNLFEASLPLGIGTNLDANPFIFVIVDWRGFYGSSAATVSSPNRGQDGYDVCEWITQQSWHKDRIGTWGASALGKIQWETAREQHPNHTCAVPIVAHPQTYYEDYFYGGVLEEARLNQMDALGYGISTTVLANPYYSNLWAVVENNTWYPSDIEIPCLTIGGWYDHNIDKMNDWYKALRTNSPAANEQWFLIGPWVHGGNGIAHVGSPTQGELTYNNAAYENIYKTWDFFNYYLLDSVNNWTSTPKINYYETGKDVWNSSNANNIEILSNNTLYLNENEQLISGNGVNASTFLCDPNNPVPTIGGANLSSNLNQGPYDQSSLDARNDLITFETGNLTQDVSISGRVKCQFYIQTNQLDGDIIVHLVDKYPDGRNMLITDAAKRMRFRNGYTTSDEAMMSSGIELIEIEFPFTNYTWKSGHQIKIYVAGNSDSRFDVNLQNGQAMYSNGTANIANITIHHNASNPSKIILPGNNSYLSISEEDLAFSIFPNPTKEVINVKSTLNFEAYKIIDVTGKIVQQGKLQSTMIQVANLLKGMYVLELMNEQHTKRTTFAKD